jgi:hypothetical protein
MPILLALWRCTVPLIIPEITYKSGSTDWKWKSGKTKMKSKENNKRMPRAIV